MMLSMWFPFSKEIQNKENIPNFFVVFVFISRKCFYEILKEKKKNKSGEENTNFIHSLYNFMYDDDVDDIHKKYRYFL